MVDKVTDSAWLAILGDEKSLRSEDRDNDDCLRAPNFNCWTLIKRVIVNWRLTVVTLSLHFEESTNRKTDSTTPRWVQVVGLLSSSIPYKSLFSTLPLQRLLQSVSFT